MGNFPKSNPNHKWLSQPDPTRVKKFWPGPITAPESFHCPWIYWHLRPILPILSWVYILRGLFPIAVFSNHITKVFQYFFHHFLYLDYLDEKLTVPSSCTFQFSQHLRKFTLEFLANWNSLETLLDNLSVTEKWTGYLEADYLISHVYLRQHQRRLNSNDNSLWSQPRQVSTFKENVHILSFSIFKTSYSSRWRSTYLSISY